MRNVPYEQQTLNHPNPIARYAHRSRLKLALETAGKVLPVGGTLLDYGSGQGAYLAALRERLKSQNRENERLVGYDPFMPVAFPGVEIVADLSAIPDRSVDCVTVLEVCEHLDDKETESMLTEVARVLKPGGQLLVTVPIVIGPVILIKELSRCLLFRRWSDHSIGELLSCAFLCKVPRRAESIKHSHRGYDWRVTRERLSQRWALAAPHFSPFPRLPSGFNSQVLLHTEINS